MFSNRDLETQLALMGAGDTIACSHRLVPDDDVATAATARPAVYDRDEAAWLGHAGAALVAAPPFKV
jgi:hypothetical protein